jgi:predicted DNA-binding transcriptional regulator AlpA
LHRLKTKTDHHLKNRKSPQVVTSHQTLWAGKAIRLSRPIFVYRAISPARGITDANDERKGETMATTSQALPELLTKKQAAELLQCSQRQIELLTQKGRIAKPVYLGDRSPRWRRAELLASLGTVQEGGAE